LERAQREERGPCHFSLTCVLLSFLTPKLSRHSYDYDIDPVKRKGTPYFYGYIADDGSTRLVMLAIMTLNAALLLLVRSFSAALLLLVAARYFFLYSVCDICVYLAYKIARDDFHHWAPVSGVGGTLVSLLVRIIVKVCTDYTGVVQSRASGEMGGIYWFVNIMLALTSAFVAAQIYFVSVASKAGDELGGGEDLAGSNSTTSVASDAVELDRGSVWMIIGFLCSAWILTFAVFLILMKKEYRGTFFSFETGKQWTMNYFLLSDDDSRKKGTVLHNKSQWREIRGDVKAWVQKNWWIWREEKPEWFTDNWIAKLDDDFIPTEEDRSRLNVVRRRNSFALLGGGRRLSLKDRAKVVPSGGSGTDS
jgi:hypothetical protein